MTSGSSVALDELNTNCMLGSRKIYRQASQLCRIETDSSWAHLKSSLVINYRQPLPSKAFAVRLRHRTEFQRRLYYERQIAECL